MNYLKAVIPLAFLVVNVAQATEITKTSATGTTFKFTATLDAPLMTGYKVKIDFGKGGLKAMTCFAKTCTLSSNVLPSGVSTATYKIGIYNNNVLQGSTSDGTYVISPTTAITTSTSIKPTEGYTKIANDGSDLPDSATLGKNPKDWACTRDNSTNLSWEVKTDDNGLRDKDWMYSWYEPDATKNGENAGTENTTGTCMGIAKCNTNAYQIAVNKRNLCGANDWRMPTIAELNSIVKSVETYANPSIDKTFFPNTESDKYWSSSPYANLSGFAWGVNFGGGFSNGYGKNDGNYVRLVR